MPSNFPGTPCSAHLPPSCPPHPTPPYPHNPWPSIYFCTILGHQGQFSLSGTCLQALEVISCLSQQPIASSCFSLGCVLESPRSLSPYPLAPITQLWVWCYIITLGVAHMGDATRTAALTAVQQGWGDHCSLPPARHSSAFLTGSSPPRPT